MRLCILDDINKVRLCFLTQNYTINRKSKIMLAVLFGINCLKKKMLAKPNNAKKCASTIGKSLVLPRQVN